jgi:alkaline phosphatase D
MKKRILLATLGLPMLAIAQNDFNQRSGINPSLEPFYHGVASGDPLHDRVIIWTRPTPDGSFVPGDSIQVDWRMATDTGMTNVVASGTVYAKEARDFCVKVDVTGLQPYTCYYYDFNAYNKYSLRGRTKTAPMGDNDSARFAVMSCSNYEYGYFHSYRAVVERNDVDAVLHLGDYIYEYEVGGYSANIAGREHDPATEIISLSDYRTRYSHYRLDDDSRSIHQQFAFITVWDDHESADNSWMDGAENHTDGTEGVWSTRKSNSKQAYFEWLPVRENPVNNTQLYRTIQYGDLLNLYMLDTRLEGRSEQVAATSPDVNSSTRSMLGSAQYTWLTNELSNSTARWNVLGQQVMMAPLKVFGAIVNADQWDGYAYERDQLYNHILGNSIQNVVVLTGDIHTAWANDLPGAGYNSSTGANSVGAEFVVTSVTSPGFSFPVPPSLIQASNGHMKWLDLTQKGFMILDLNKTRTQCDWYFVGNVSNAYSGYTHAASWKVNNNARNITNAGSPSSRTNPECTQAPEDPISTGSGAAVEENALQMLGMYPNPVDDRVLIQYNAPESGDVVVSFVDANGREVIKRTFQSNVGLNYLVIGTEELSPGMYQVVLTSGNKRTVGRIVK